MRIGNRDFEPDKKTYIMGILNITPDSFSDGGKWNDAKKMIAACKKHAKEMQKTLVLSETIVEIPVDSTLELKVLKTKGF